MWTFISVSLALIINFFTPNIPLNNKFIKNTDQKKPIKRSFPQQYYEGEFLSEDMVAFRIRGMYIYFMISLFSVGSMGHTVVPQSIFISPSISLERLSLNELDCRINHEELILNFRGGGATNEAAESIIQYLLVRTMVRNSRLANGFQPKVINYHHYGQQGNLKRDPKLAPKLQDNPGDGNNFGRGDCGSSQKKPTMDQLSNSLSSEYRDYQRKYYSDSLPKRFDTSDYSPKKFKDLARNPQDNTFSKTSVDEARAITQADLEGLVIKPSRMDMATSKRVDLDFKVEGPAPWTHVDIKTPVGSDILKKQNQIDGVEGMGYKVGVKIVAQKNRFIGKINGPLKPENVGHIVDLSYVPFNEREIVKKNVLQGARDMGSEVGITFLNEI